MTADPIHHPDPDVGEKSPELAVSDDCAEPAIEPLLLDGLPVPRRLRVEWWT
jgi:hypothetical protein